jgi:transcriptional regulator with XRE-family HTH domain
MPSRAISEDARQFVERCERYRQEHRLTQEGMARRLGVSQTDYNRWINRGQSPQPHAVVKGAAIFDLSLSQALYEAGYWPEGMALGAERPPSALSAEQATLVRAWDLTTDEGRVVLLRSAVGLIEIAEGIDVQTQRALSRRRRVKAVAQ